MCIFNLFEQVIRNIVLFKNQAAPHLKLRQVPKLGVFLQVIVNNYEAITGRVITMECLYGVFTEDCEYEVECHHWQV